jgi:hypothetical protein
MVAEARADGAGAVVGDFLHAAIVENKGGAGGMAGKPCRGGGGSVVLPELIVGQPSKILPQRGAQQVAYGSAGQTGSGIKFKWERVLAG